jgi:VWFA-related protein
MAQYRAVKGVTVGAAVAFALLVAAASPGGGSAQAPQDTSEPPVFRGSVETVVVDVVVTDREGRPVTGLTADDFEIYENGRPQAISVFTPVDVPVERSERIWPDTEPDVQANTNPPGRVYLFLLDGSVSDVHALRARHWLRLFFDNYFGDNDLATVVVSRGLVTDGQDFTSNRRLLLAAVDKFAGDHMHVRQLRDLQEWIEVLARMPARQKAIVWITGRIGFDAYDVMDYQDGVLSLVGEHAHAAMSAATRGNIRIYPIDPAGGMSDSGGGDTLDFGAVAALTGGFSHKGSNDFAGAFERLVREQSTYYILGFESTQPRKSGRYSKFEVKLKRPELEIRARPGVVEPLDYVFRRERPRPKESPVATALGNPIAVPGAPLRVVATPFLDKASNAMVALTVDLASSGLRFTEKSGQYELAFDVRHLATDARKKIYPEFRHPATMTVSPAVRQNIVDQGLRVVSEFALPPGRYQVRVASAGADKPGSVVYDLEVPDLRDGPLTMSGVALTSDSAKGVFTLQADVGERYSKPKDCDAPVCNGEVRSGRALAQWPARSLKAPFLWQDALPSPPTTSREFDPSETLTAFVEVYDNSKPTGEKVPYALDLTATLQNPGGDIVRSLKQERPSNGPRRPSGGHGFVVPVPLAGLPPGPYLLQLEARTLRTPDFIARRQIPIRIR